jgi:predicted nucleotidyltransferase
MTATRPYLIEMICGLADRGVEFIVCGGMAAVYHGVERMTMDLDISLNMTTENITRFLDAAEELHLTPRPPVPAESLLDPEKIKDFVGKKNARVFTFWDRDNPYRQIDVFLTGDALYHDLLIHTVDAEVDGRTVKILSAKKLVEMKSNMTALRDKDELDIRTLKRILEKTNGNER